MTSQRYIYGIQSGDLVKIGISFSPESRAKAVAFGEALPCHLLGFVPATIEQERTIHALLRRWNVRGEWFDASAPAVAEFCRLIAQCRPAVVASGLQALLKERGWSLARLAVALGVDKATVTRWNQRRTPPERLAAIEELTGIPRERMRPDVFGPLPKSDEVARP